MELDPKFAKSRHGGRRAPGPGKKLGRPADSIASILVNLPLERKKAFLRSLQEAVERMIKKILRGENLITLVAKAGQIDGAAQAQAGEHASPATPGVACATPSRHGGRRAPGPGKKLGRPAFTVDGICRRYPQHAERLRRDIARLAAEAVARRLGVTIADMRKARRKARAKNTIPGVAGATPSRHGGRRAPGPGKKLGRPAGTHNPRNLPLYLRILRTKVGIGRGGAKAKWGAAELEAAIALYPKVKSWGQVAKRLRLSEWENNQKGTADRLRLAVDYYRVHRKREN